PELKMSRPVPNPGILDIAPYTPGKSPVPEPGRKVFKLSANETPFGPSPKAIAAYQEAAAHLEDYPEGTWRLLREAIGRALVLDPAYCDYVSRNDYELGIELVATTDNTVMTHTFSKIHGLAALRIGWMFGPAHIVDAVNRIRGPFNVSTPAMLAAVAALQDTA